MPPRITEQSYRPRVSDRTMVARFSCNRFACCASGNRIESVPLLSLFVDRPRTVLAVKGSRRRAETARRREPLTARTVLGRSTKRERRGTDSIRFPEAQQAKRLHENLATIVLSETRGL